MSLIAVNVCHTIGTSLIFRRHAMAHTIAADAATLIFFFFIRRQFRCRRFRRLRYSVADDVAYVMPLCQRERAIHCHDDFFAALRCRSLPHDIFHAAKAFSLRYAAATYARCHLRYARHAILI